MSKSRKNKSRRKARHHRQLRNQFQRKRIRGEAKYVPSGFVLSLFLKRHKVEMFLLALLFVVILGILLAGPDKKSIKKMSNSVSSLIEAKSQYWDEAYPYGYKIISLMDKDIIHTSFDSLPEDLKIDWKRLSVVRIQSKQFGSIDEKIKIGITGIYYSPAGISNRDITVTLTRKKGASVVLTRFNGLKFVAEIVEDNGEQVFCLFGLR